MALRLRQLEAFQAVARLGSMTRAAGHLNVSQPAVSRLLSSFAQTVGFEPFERKGGQLVPTQEARYLLSEVTRVLDGVQNIEELSRDLTARTAGHLRIACLPGFATSHLPGVLMPFLSTRPGVTVTLEPDRPERILEWIIGEQYDCGITDGFTGHPATESRNIRLRSVCIFPKGHHFGAKSEIWPEDIVGEKLIHTRRGSAFYVDLSQAFVDCGVALPSWIETRQFTAACMMVSLGTGVSVVSELDAMQFVATGIGIGVGTGIEMRPFLPEVSHKLSILRPIAKTPSVVTLEFIETFADSLLPFLSAP